MFFFNFFYENEFCLLILLLMLQFLKVDYVHKLFKRKVFTDLCLEPKFAHLILQNCMHSLYYLHNSFNQSFASIHSSLISMINLYSGVM